MKKVGDFDQGTTIILINALRKKETKVFDNKVNMNELRCQRSRKVFQC